MDGAPSPFPSLDTALAASKAKVFSDMSPSELSLFKPVELLERLAALTPAHDAVLAVL